MIRATQDIVVRRDYVDGPHGQIHYRYASPRGPVVNRPLILLHQNPSSSFEYERLIEEMAFDREVVAFDTPGYGMSSAPPAPLDMAEYAGSFAVAAQALGLFEHGGCDVFGVHTGSLLALELAIAAPAIRRIVVSGIPMRSAGECAVRLAAALDAAPLDEAGHGIFASAQKLWDFIVVQRLPGVPLRRAAEAWIDKLAPLDRHSWAYQGVWSYDYAARLPLVGQPVLLIQPDEEIAAYSRAAAAMLANSRTVDLDGFSRDLFELPAALAAICTAMRRFFDQDEI